MSQHVWYPNSSFAVVLSNDQNEYISSYVSFDCDVGAVTQQQGSTSCYECVIKFKWCMCRRLHLWIATWGILIHETIYNETL